MPDYKVAQLTGMIFLGIVSSRQKSLFPEDTKISTEIKLYS